MASVSSVLKQKQIATYPNAVMYFQEHFRHWKYLIGQQYLYKKKNGSKVLFDPHVYLFGIWQSALSCRGILIGTGMVEWLLNLEGFQSV